MSGAETERKVRRLRGISALTASAVLFSACSVDTKNNNASPNISQKPQEVNPTITITPTPEPSSTIIIETPKPAPTPVETPKPTESVEKTIEEIAMEKALNSWVSTVNSGTQKSTNDGALPGIYVIHALNVKASNIQEWQKNIPVILNGEKSSTVLKTKWFGGGYYTKEGDPNSLGNKSTGEIEINNVQVTSLQPISLSDADKANGTEWSGIAKINYIERYHSNYYFALDTTALSKVKTWINSPDKNPFPAFSQWKDSSYDVKVSLKNGSWQSSILNSERKGTFVDNSSDMFRDFVIPSESLNYMGCTPTGSPCQRVNINLSSLK